MSKSSFLSGNFAPLDRSVTLAKMASGTDGNLISYDSSGNPAYVSTGNSGDVLVSAGAGAPPTFSALTTGKVLQVVSTQTGASSTTTTIMPRDDTIPQNTEGFEVMTLAITPTSSSNKLLIEVLTFTGFSADNNSCVALFQDSTAGALASANTGYAVSTILPTQNGHIRHYMTAGTTSETTFKVRCGSAASGTTTFNGGNGARTMGGTLCSSITITEISA